MNEAAHEAVMAEDPEDGLSVDGSIEEDEASVDGSAAWTSDEDLDEDESEGDEMYMQWILFSDTYNQEEIAERVQLESLGTYPDTVYWSCVDQGSERFQSTLQVLLERSSRMATFDLKEVAWGIDEETSLQLSESRDCILNHWSKRAMSTDCRLHLVKMESCPDAPYSATSGMFLGDLSKCGKEYGCFMYLTWECLTMDFMEAFVRSVHTARLPMLQLRSIDGSLDVNASRFPHRHDWTPRALPTDFLWTFFSLPAFWSDRRSGGFRCHGIPNLMFHGVSWQSMADSIRCLLLHPFSLTAEVLEWAPYRILLNIGASFWSADEYLLFLQSVSRAYNATSTRALSIIN